MFITYSEYILIQIDLSNNYQPLDFSSNNKNKFKINLEDSILRLEDYILEESRI